MATRLYRLGRFAFRSRRLVAFVWIALLVLVGVGASTLAGHTSDSFTIPGVEAQQALDTLKAKMGLAADNASARVVFATAGDTKLTDAAPRAAVQQAVAALSRAEHVVAVTDPFSAQGLSKDAHVAYVQVAYDVTAAEVTQTARTQLFAAGRTAQGAGVEVEFGGPAAQEPAKQSATELIGLVMAAFVLTITFGSLVAAGLPLLTAILGVALGALGVQIASGFFDLSASTSSLALMLGLAVGIDYALFIVSRYRHELTLGRDKEQAAGRAVGTAGSAVVFAGLTVIIALAALSVVGIPFLTSMGLAAAGTVAVAVLIALTLLPALLGFVGDRILGKAGRTRRRDTVAVTDPFGARWARAIVRSRVPALVVPALALLVVALPVRDLHLGLPDDSTAAPHSTQRNAYDLLSQGFGPGFNGPLLVVVEGTSGDTKAAAEQAQERITRLPGVVAAMPPTLNAAGDTAVLTVVPSSGPSDSATEVLVAAIRAEAHALHADTGATLAVTGSTALGIDVSAKLTAALVPYMAVVVGLAFLLLLLVFRSLLVPLKATLGFLLSVAATLGAVVAVFQWGWLNGILGVQTTGPIIAFLPIFLVGVLFGLAMDYEVFLVTRMREEFVHGGDPQQAVITGMGHGARVVPAAALIMIGVFSGFVVSDQAVVKTIGFALAVGVAVDAFVVRMVIVPAVLSLLGRSAWWLPRWLDRVLPNIDVEGERLGAQLHGDEPGRVAVSV